MKTSTFILTLIIFIGCNNLTSSNESFDKKKNDRRFYETDVPSFANKKAEKYYVLGNEYRDAKNDEKAKEYYIKSFLNDSTHLLNINNLANACIRLEHFDEAENYLEKALALDSSYSGTYINYMNLTIRREDYSHGIAIGNIGLLKSLKDRNTGLIHLNLCLLNMYLKDCEEAKKQFQLAQNYYTTSFNTAYSSIENGLNQNCP